MNSSQGWNEIIKGKRGISAQAAILIARRFNTSPEFWLNMQQAWDLAAAYRELKKNGQAA